MLKMLDFVPVATSSCALAQSVPFSLASHAVLTGSLSAGPTALCAHAGRTRVPGTGEPAAPARSSLFGKAGKLDLTRVFLSVILLKGG